MLVGKLFSMFCEAKMMTRTTMTLIGKLMIRGDDDCDRRKILMTSVLGIAGVAGQSGQVSPLSTFSNF